MKQVLGRSVRFDALDALRGICALLVVLFHIPIYHALKDVKAFANLQVCVDLFFILSGFVLCHAYGARLSQAEPGGLRWFLARRIARLWPLHVAVLAVLVALEAAKFAFEQSNSSVTVLSQSFSQGHSVYEILTNLTFLHSFGLHAGMSWNGPSWSVAVEFYLSIVFALLMPLGGLWRRAVFAGLAFAALLGLQAVSPNSLFVSTDWGILRAALGFFVGCLIYELRAGSEQPLSTPTAFEVASLAVLVACGVLLRPGPGHYLFPFACACVVLVFSFGNGLVSKTLRRPALQLLGLWSYAIYMVHTSVFQLFKSVATYAGNKTGLDLVTWHNDEKLVLIGTPTQAIAPTLVLSVVLVVPLAALCYRFIERPGIDRFGRRLERWFGVASRSAQRAATQREPNGIPAAPVPLSQTA